MKKTTLTAKQQETLDYMRSFSAKNGQAPTITDLAKGLGLESLRSVTQRLESLEAKGFIKRDRFKHRGITILEGNPAAPAGTVQVPVVMSAGCDAAEVYAQGVYDEFLMLDKTLTEGKNDLVVVKAIGNSMIDAGIHNGDYVLVEVTENVSNGDRVVAVLGDMAVVKKLHVTPSAVVLEPESHGNGYSPIIMSGENSKILGRVLSVIPMSAPDDDYQFIPEPGVK